MVVDCSVTNFVALDRLNKQTLTLAPSLAISSCFLSFQTKLIMVMSDHLFRARNELAIRMIETLRAMIANCMAEMISVTRLDQCRPYYIIVK